ncbi:MAG: endonuclease MutS2 [Lachnospiraceae bacterium]|nr:endonuclease MutS2 [Lachnospiraceae bacterium]
MNKKAFHTLEFDKITELLCKEATSRPGEAMCKKLTPSDDGSQIALRLSQTEAAVSRLLASPGSVSFGNLRDFSSQLSRLSIEGSLNAGELLALAGFLENVARVKAFGRIKNETAEDEGDCLSGFFEELAPLSDHSARIRQCILSEEEIADDASPLLRDLRRKQARLQDRIHTHLSSMVTGSARTYLMDAVITQKNGRYCLPVKAEHKGSIPGIVHEKSSTGSTLFIEPAAIVDMNNQIRELLGQEKDEIERILAELSLQLSAEVGALKRNCELMGILDFIFAKARLALLMKASRPVMHEESTLSIRKGRHPLLHPESVVPIDVKLEPDTRQMIITGPNTGGKTVTLKTIGLFSLMAQAGLFIPAMDNSHLPIYKDIFADIGDEQSIEQNLSTFSSHMTNIVSILKQADARSLVLFDELCSGTDPDEGAALAISILQHLLARKSLTMATTHYSEIKLYALSTPKVVNACCEFDVQSLQPTYRLLIGIPGKSNAFAISQKLGLSETIIQNAKAQISKEQEDFEDVLADLEKKRLTMEKELLEFSEKSAELEKRLKTVENRELELENKKQKILAEANEKARDILQEAKDVADETIRSFNAFSGNTSIQDMEKKRANIREKIQDKNEKLSLKNTVPKAPAQKVSPKKLRLGDTVKILSMNLKGSVVTLPDNKGNLFVQCGIIRTKAQVDDIILIEEDTITGPGISHSSYGKITMSKSRNVGTEINLLGKTVDEAIMALDKYLDDAYMAHIPMVRVVHGKGTGALRSAVHQYLKRQKHVKDYRLGEFGEGDAGVTIVTFR